MPDKDLTDADRETIGCLRADYILHGGNPHEAAYRAGLAAGREIEAAAHEKASTDARAITAAIGLPPFEDAEVQIVYDILCDNTAPPHPAMHLEGWNAQRIVAAIRALAKPEDTHGN